MRHTTATALLELGEAIEIIQEVLGHADVRTTRGYQDIDVELTRRAPGAWTRSFSVGLRSLILSCQGAGAPPIFLIDGLRTIE
jgi:hypothetical protein